MIKTVNQTNDPLETLRGEEGKAGVRVSYLVTWLFCEVLASSMTLHLSFGEAKFRFTEFSGYMENSFLYTICHWRTVFSK